MNPSVLSIKRMSTVVLHVTATLFVAVPSEPFCMTSSGASANCLIANWFYELQFLIYGRTNVVKEDFRGTDGYGTGN